MATINDITCDQSPLEHQIIAIFEKDTKNKFCIINIYNPCIQIKHKHIDQIIDKIKSANFIICGDLNGHSPLWGSSKTDCNGKIIEDIIEKHDLVCINNGSGTRMNTHRENNMHRYYLDLQNYSC